MAKSLSAETYEVINPATEEVIGKASKANSKDVQNALQSASKGLKIWSTHLHGKEQELSEKYLNL